MFTENSIIEKDSIRVHEQTPILLIQIHYLFFFFFTFYNNFYTGDKINIIIMIMESQMEYL